MKATLARRNLPFAGCGWVLDVLLRSPQLMVDRADQVVRALQVYRAGNADLADCLIEHMANAAGCGRTMTFDVGAAKTAGMELLV